MQVIHTSIESMHRRKSISFYVSGDSLIVCTLLTLHHANGLCSR